MIAGEAFMVLCVAGLGWWVARELRGQRRRMQTEIQRRARARARRNGGRR